MREIKFRAWDRGKNKMVATKRHALNFDGTGVAYHQTAGRWNYLGSENYVLMQYTGLLDKNGTEIYEGDIVVVHDVTGDYPPEKIEFHAGSFYVGRSLLGELPYKAIEVMGNLMENPELLKDGGSDV